jgi:hypothetical protein
MVSFIPIFINRQRARCAFYNLNEYRNLAGTEQMTTRCEEYCEGYFGMRISDFGTIVKTRSEFRKSQIRNCILIYSASSSFSICL